ncbi:MAG: MFS transporter, partial [Acidimicrobiales bacterium]
AYPFVISGLHVSYGALGLVLGISGIAGGLLQGLAGMAGRYSARFLLCAQNIGLAISSLVGGLAPGFFVFGAARFVGSVVSWPQHPIGSAALTKRFPKRRAYALSWHVAGGSIGTAVIPLVVSALIAAYGWRVGVEFLAIPLAIGGILVGWRLRDPVRTAEPTVRRDHMKAVRSLLRSREATGAIIAGTIAAGGRGLGTLSVFVPAYLKSGLHLHVLTVGSLFTVLLLGSIAGPVIAGWVADRAGRRRILVVTYLVGAVAIASFVLVGRSVIALGVVGALMGLFAFSESPLLQAVFSEGLDETDHQGAFGYYFAISYGFGSVWTIALGEIIDTLGFHWAFYVMAASFVAASVVVLWARPPRARTPRAPGSEALTT